LSAGLDDGIPYASGDKDVFSISSAWGIFMTRKFSALMLKVVASVVLAFSLDQPLAIISPRNPIAFPHCRGSIVRRITILALRVCVQFMFTVLLLSLASISSFSYHPTRPRAKNSCPLTMDFHTVHIAQPSQRRIVPTTHVAA
jgi:hypothetical protein